jgi:hypothetical protein
MNRESYTRVTLTDADDVVAILMRDHGRTRQLMRRALRLTVATGPDPGCAAVARAMVEFFRYWNPLHELDEEQALMPALRVWAPSRVPSPPVAEAFERTVADHVALDGLREELGRGWDALAAEPALLPDLRREMAALTRALVRKMGAHMAWEERELFPLFRRHVPPEVQARAKGVLLARRARPVAQAAYALAG